MRRPKPLLPHLPKRDYTVRSANKLLESRTKIHIFLTLKYCKRNSSGNTDIRNKVASFLRSNGLAKWFADTHEYTKHKVEPTLYLEIRTNASFSPRLRKQTTSPQNYSLLLFTTLCSLLSKKGPPHGNGPCTNPYPLLAKKNRTKSSVVAPSGAFFKTVFTVA